MLSSSWSGFFKEAIIDSGLNESHVAQDGPRRPKRARIDGNSHAAREVGLMKRSSDHRTATFIGSGSGIHFVRAVYNALASGQEAKSSSAAAELRESDVVPGEDEQLSGMATFAEQTRLWRPDEISNALSQSDSLNFDKLLVWSESYWTNWHSVFPFLFAPDVLLWLERIVANGLKNPFNNLNGFQVAIVRAAFSIALADRRQEQSPQAKDPIPALLVFDSFENAVNSVQRALIDRPSMEAIQAAVAVQLFLVSMLRQGAAARLGGLIHSMVYQLGLHRCPTRYPTFSEHESSMRKRVLWSVYCLDRHVSQSLGSPLGIRDDDLDVCFLDDERHAADSFQAHDLDDRLALLNLMSRIFKAKGRILEYCNKSINHRLTDPDASVLLSSEIAKVGNAIDEFLDNRPSTDALPGVHVTSLKVLKQECVISLNRPLLALAKHDSSYKAGLQVCVGASRAIITALFHAVQQASDTAGTSSLLFPTSTWAVWMSAFILVYAAVEGEVPIATCKLLANRSIDILKLLSRRGSFWPNACAAAIRDLLHRLEQAQRTADKDEYPPTALSRSMDPDTMAIFPIQGTQIGSSSATDIFGGYIKSTDVPWYAEKHMDESQQAQVKHGGSQSVSQEATSASGGTPGHGRNDDAWASLLDNVQGAQNPASRGTANQDSSVDLFDGFDIPFWMGEYDLNLE